MQRASVGDSKLRYSMKKLKSLTMMKHRRNRKMKKDSMPKVLTKKPVTTLSKAIYLGQSSSHDAYLVGIGGEGYLSAPMLHARTFCFPQRLRAHYLKENQACVARSQEFCYFHRGSKQLSCNRAFDEYWEIRNLTSWTACSTCLMC